MGSAFRAWLMLVGVISISIGLAHLLFGATTIIGAGPVDATVDSELRFYAAVFIGLGAGFVWAARDIVARAGAINALGLVFLLGAVARLVSWVAVGPPHAFYLAMIPVEVLVPVINWWVLRRLRSAPDPASRQR